MNNPPNLPAFTSAAATPPAMAYGPKPKGRPLAITSVVIATIGVLPLIVYFFNCISQLGTRSSYFGNGGNPLLILAMGFIGFVIHGAGLICGIVGVCMASKKLSLLGLIGNAVILCAVLLFGFIAIAGA